MNFATPMSTTWCRRMLPIAAMLLLFTNSALTYASDSEPMSRGADVVDIKELPKILVGSVDVQQRLDEDAASTDAGPLRYAIPVVVSVTPQTDGTWEALEDGSQIWRYRVSARGATDLNFGFTEYYLPKGATLHIISESQNYFHGPYTENDNQAHGQHWTPMVPGEGAIIELFLPQHVVNDTSLRLKLGHIGMGYRDLFGKPNLTRQGACNIDTICPEGDNWRDDIRASSQYSLGGSYFCSGTMIMDVPGSFRSWYLTAQHCGITAGNAASLVVLWNFESSVCGALSGGIASDVQTGGATWRAARTDADFTLVELNTVPDPSFNVYYSGWDATGAVPLSSVGISHPSNDEKALAFNDDALTTGASCIGPNTPGTHWYVDNYELGMTEPGSSGSGIWNTYSSDPFNPTNRRLVGVLSGGGAACAGSVPNNLGDCYGKFSVAWDDGTTATTRLVDWLDPADTGITIRNGSDPIPAICGDGGVGGSEQCDDGNSVGGDGCSATCTIEPGFTCTNPADAPSVCSAIVCGNGVPQTGEQCDDGNNVGGDGCSASCDIEEGFTCENPPDGSPSICEMLPEGCNQPNVAIPDNSAVGVSDSLSMTGGIIQDLDVQIVATHTWVGDLVVTLTNETTGTSVTLIDRPGFTGSGFGCDGANVDTTLDDASTSPVESACSATPPAISGTLSPNGALSGFNGETLSGVWTLTVSDNASQDTGTFDEWCLLPTIQTVDSDGDGVSDDLDNCTDVANADQRDTNGDGYGNLCDPDLNNDGIVNFVDVQIWTESFNTANNGDPDFNGDGLVNFLDFAILPGFFLGPPGPSGVAP